MAAKRDRQVGGLTPLSFRTSPQGGESSLGIRFLLVGNKPAVKRVAELTGAGLGMSKDFVDGLQ